VQRSRKIVLLAVGLVSIGAILFANFRTPPSEDVPEIAGFVYPQPKPIAAFALEDHTGSTVNLDTLKGKWSFVYFGYTSCPDVCPLTLFELSGAQAALADAGLDADNQYFFVSVDPQRDTPQRLGNYVSHFNRKLIGVSGTERMLQSFAQDVGTLYDFPDGKDGDNYVVAHSSTLALFDPGGRLHAIFTYPQKSDGIADGFRKIRQRWQSRPAPG